MFLSDGIQDEIGFVFVDMRRNSEGDFNFGTASQEVWQDGARSRAADHIQARGDS